MYRPGDIDEKQPILLLDDKDRLTEISHKSDIIRSISDIHIGKHHVYYPEELLLSLDRTRYTELDALFSVRK
ncbi:hypothetical protein D3C87_2125780 [compost metagenome]